jgi:hypothetical protein
MSVALSADRSRRVANGHKCSKIDQIDGDRTHCADVSVFGRITTRASKNLVITAGRNMRDP